MIRITPYVIVGTGEGFRGRLWSLPLAWAWNCCIPAGTGFGKKYWRWGWGEQGQQPHKNKLEPMSLPYCLQPWRARWPAAEAVGAIWPGAAQVGGPGRGGGWGSCELGYCPGSANRPNQQLSVKVAIVPHFGSVTQNHLKLRNRAKDDYVSFQSPPWMDPCPMDLPTDYLIL